MPRSGSELLQVILHQNPDIYASATSPLLEFQFAARQNMGLPEVRSQPPALMESAFISMCEGMARSYYQRITDRPVVCDKNRGWSHYYEWVDRWNPAPKMLCLVRDLRDIVASLERIYRNTRHLPFGPDNPAEISGMTVEQRAQYWLNTQPVGLALARTADLFQRGVAKQIHFVRYEDLCNHPEDTLSDCYGYLDLPVFVGHNFSTLSKEVAEDHSYFGPYGDHSVASELRPAKSNAWADVLPKPVASAIRKEFDWYFDAFRY